VANNLVEKSGAWYSYNGDRIGQGKENARQFLKDNPDIANTLSAKLRADIMPVRQSRAAAAAEAAEAAEALEAVEE
jgi:recombination protein RecA